MTTRFQYRLSSLFWLAAIVAVNCVTVPPVYHEFISMLNRKPPPTLKLGFVLCDCISISDGDSSIVSLPDDEGPHWYPKLPPPELPDPEIPEWQPTELTYLNDDDTATVELVGGGR